MMAELTRTKDIRFIAGIRALDKTDLMILEVLVEHSTHSGGLRIAKEKFPGERPAQVVGLLMGSALYTRTQEKTSETKT